MRQSISALLAIVQLTVAIQLPFLPTSHTEGYKFDPLLHLPGISPYFDAVGSGLNHKAPRDCEVTAATYLVRHAAIYANDKDYEDYIEPFIKKLNITETKVRAFGILRTRRDGWSGPLAFFATWKNPIDDPENQLEKITLQGLKDSQKVGKHLFSRYPDLVPTTKKVYADKKSRTKDTATAFIKSFPQDVDIVEVRDSHETFHSQNPHKACKAFTKEPGDNELKIFMGKYIPSIISRLQPFSPVELEQTDIMGLQQLCGYESAITGKKSDICHVFTDDEWMAYEYAWDLKYLYMVGHGNPLSPYLGFPWLNTTAELFEKFHDDHAKEGGQRFFLSFTHREVPPFIATALGLFNSSNAFAEEFPTDRINWSRSWKMAELIPFLGHVGIEKMTCKRSGAGLGAEADGGNEYVRIIANTAPRPIPFCQDGPGASCSFEGFKTLVADGMSAFGDFDRVCGNKNKNMDGDGDVEGEL
ncbi:histidine phosphatase superfamily [Calycina marina]|uniref:Histidine phosphatase superfamily n=1 Tax=Calycina marina TaxID=1763456 RepID=A0A9P7YWG5_9HELO|nr:histidine phosphatase superfamily [Calycina marina]